MDRYWVGGTGNWDASTTTNWSASSGGAGGASVPTSSDNVIFNSLSNATAYTVTITATANCADFTMAGPLVGAVTWAGSSALNIYGSMSLSGTAGITRTYNSTITFASTSTGKTITTNNVNLGSIIVFDGVGGGWTMSDNFTSNAGSNGITLTNGSVDFNGKTIFSGGAFSSNNSNTRTITMGAADFTSANGWNVATTTGLTFNKGTSIIRLTNGGSVSFSGGGLTYYDVTVTGQTITFNQSNTFNSLNVGSAGSPTGHGATFSASQTITGTFTSTGNSAINRNFIKSSTIGTTITITAGTVTTSNTDFQDITGAGAGSWTGTSLGDCGGNSGITFTTPTNQHWVSASSGNWSIAGNWTSRVPLPQDTALMDCAFGTSQTVTSNMPRMGAIDWTGATWTTALSWNIDNTGGITPKIYGGLILINDLTEAGSTNVITFEGRGSYNINFANKTLQRGITMNAPGGTLTMTGSFTIGVTRTLTITSGTFSNGGAGNVISAGGIIAASVAGSTITLGSATHLITGTSGFQVQGAGAGTVNSNTSTIKYTDTSNTAVIFSGLGKTFYNVWFSRGASTGSITITGSNTFTDFKDDGSAAHSILFTTGTTQTVTTFTVNGTAGNLKTINSTTTGTHALVKAGGGTITCDYLSIQHSVATPTLTWLATNSTNNQATATAGSGWYFGAFTSVKTINGLAYASVKTINGLTTASVKTINGLA